MGLKDQIQGDLDIFFDLNECAEMHNLNGKDVACIIDSDIDKKRSDRESEEYDGIYLSIVKVFVSALLLPKKPKKGKLFKLDNEPYTVIECSEDGGVYEVTLGLNDS